MTSVPFSDTLCSPYTITIHLNEFVVNFKGETYYAYKNQFTL